MEELIGLLVWLIFVVVLCLLVGKYASRRGLSATRYFLLSVLLSPVIGFLLVLVFAPSDPTRKCPHCAESVKRDAKVCRHCGRDLPPAASSAAEERARVRAEIAARKAGKS